MSSVGGGESAVFSTGVDPVDSDEVMPDETINLSWSSPESNADGSPLTDLSGYIIYYVMDGDDEEMYSLDVGNLTYATIESLLPGTWCFTVTAYDSSGIESNFSNHACKEI